MDTLTGGAALDRFLFETIGQSSANANAADLITDFSQEDGDVIDISAIGLLAFIGDSAFSGMEGELRYEFDGEGQTIMQLDLDGDALADMAIRLTGEIALEESDFQLVPPPLPAEPILPKSQSPDYEADFAQLAPIEPISEFALL